MDLALQEDARFDEVGPAGQVLWYLKRLEPEEARETPSHSYVIRKLIMTALCSLQRC